MSMIFPERRHRRRYLTLKNAAITGIALVVAFILLSIWSQLRPAHSAASGNLFESGVPSSESLSVHRGPVAIVQEGSIDDHPGTDSILIDARTTRAADVSIATPSTPAAGQKDFERRESQSGTGQRMTISGGTEGVQRVKTAPAPAITETTVPAPPGQSPQS
jgi:hypothetical protein